MKCSAIATVLITLALSMLSLMGSPSPATDACTGGGSPLEWATTKADLIFLGRVADVGDATNRAPTMAPTGPPTFGPASTEVPFFSTPNTPPETATGVPALVVWPTADPAGLVGVRAVFEVQSVLVGEAIAEVVVGDEARRRAEEQQRRREAGVSELVLCAADFTPRFSLGGRYLVFIRHDDPASQVVETAYRVVDDDIVFDDDGLLRGNHGVLALMERETYDLFFAGLPSLTIGPPFYISAPSVPLASVLRAVAYLRGDSRIYPPDTGSAGLLPVR